MPAATKLSSSSPIQAYLTRLETWHQHFGHPHSNVVRSIVKQFKFPCSNKSVSLNNCQACSLGKMHHLSLSSTYNRSSSPLELIHSDVWGPAPLLSFNGDRFFVIFIDDFSVFTWFFPIKSKSDVPHVFLNFQAFVENQFNC